MKLFSIVFCREKCKEGLQLILWNKLGAFELAFLKSYRNSSF